MRPDKDKPYYTAYEERYKSVYEQGADYYGYLSFEEDKNKTVGQYIDLFNLKGKKVVEFGCGQGRAGLEFAKKGCIYLGYDIAPSALEKADTLLAEYPDAEVNLMDCVLGDFPADTFDAGIDISCLHMLIIDNDRQKYLANIMKCLKAGAPMFFVQQGKSDKYIGKVASFEQWLERTGEDLVTLKERESIKDGKTFTVMLLYISARPRSADEYREELVSAGFEIVSLETGEMWGLNILVKKPDYYS